jgi:Pentapeptide repeats (8 copies)
MATDDWDSEQKSLRRSEIQIQKWTGIAQVAVSIATVTAVLVAGYVAYQGQQTLKATTQYNLQQAQSDQLSTALTSLGSGDPTERIAGLVLLRRNAADRLMPKSIAVFGEQSALSYYKTALKVFSGYLSSHGKEFLASHRGDAQPFGLGYGKLPPLGFSIDIQYAIDEVKQMMNLKEEVQAITRDAPAFDLANDELYEENFSGMDLSWVISYMKGIDLRGAVLTNLHLSNLDNLPYSHFQCASLQGAILKGAHLEHADFRGADLTGAHLEGAYLAGADFQGANVTRANFSSAKGLRPKKLKYMYGSAIGLPSGVVPSSTKPPDLPTCLALSSYGNPPKGNLSPTFSPSTTTSPTSSRSATPSPTSSRSSTPSPTSSPSETPSPSPTRST